MDHEIPDWGRRLRDGLDAAPPDRADPDILDRPVFHQVDPARDEMYRSVSAAVFTGMVIAIMAAIPCIVWLWRWAL